MLLSGVLSTALLLWEDWELEEEEEASLLPQAAIAATIDRASIRAAAFFQYSFIMFILLL